MFQNMEQVDAPEHGPPSPELAAGAGTPRQITTIFAFFHKFTYHICIGNTGNNSWSQSQNNYRQLYLS